MNRDPYAGPFWLLLFLGLIFGIAMIIQLEQYRAFQQRGIDLGVIEYAPKTGDLQYVTNRFYMESTDR